LIYMIWHIEILSLSLSLSLSLPTPNEFTCGFLQE